MGISVMKFEELWDKFEQSGNIQDYLEYCAWNGSMDITCYVTSENLMTESGDLGGFTANGNGVSA